MGITIGLVRARMYVERQRRLGIDTDFPFVVKRDPIQRIIDDCYDFIEKEKEKIEAAKKSEENKY